MGKEQTRDLAKTMFIEGKSYSVISKKLNISESTLKSWKRRDSWVRVTPPKKKSATSKKNKKVATKGLQTKNVEKEHERIKNNLLKQLEAKGVREAMHIDLVNDYMALWAVKNKLIADIDIRGVQVLTYNSNGDEVHKKNDSIVELPKYNTQMLKLLNDLGLRAADFDSGDDDDI